MTTLLYWRYALELPDYTNRSRNCCGDASILIRIAREEIFWKYYSHVVSLQQK